MSASETSRHRSQTRWAIFIFLLGATLAGYFGAWIPSRAAALIVSGHDMAEYVKFVPQVVADQYRVVRESFYLPLLLASVASSLLASRSALSRWVRLLMGVAAAAAALAMLPPAWTPSTLQLPEFRLQVLAIAGCVMLAALTPLARFVPDLVVLGVFSILGIAASLWPTWSFLQVRPAIAELYRAPLGLSWGALLSAAACLAIAVLGIASITGRALKSHAQR